MLELSMNEITTFRWSLDEDIRNYEEMGYSAIGVWRQKLTDYGEDRAIDLLAESSLQVSNLLWAGGFTGSDGRTLADSIDDAAHALRLAADIRAGCLVVYAGGRNYHTFRHAGRLLRSALEELLPLAEAAEVPLAIEPMHSTYAQEWTFLTDLEASLRFVEEFDSPHLKLVYDSYHFGCNAQEDFPWSDLVPHLAVVHLGDRIKPPSIDQERCLLGYGQIPLDAIVAGLASAGYSGYFDVELIGQEIEAKDYWNILEQSQRTFAELTESCGLAWPSNYSRPL